LVPLKDNVHTAGVPALTLLVIVASVVLYAIDWDPDLTELAWPWAALASLLIGTSLLALAINMLFLWLFAESLEGSIGPALLAALLVVAGVAAAGAQELARPSTTIPTVGIAGSIAGLIGAYAVCLPGARILCWVLIPFFVTFVELPALILAALWLVLQAIPEVGQPPAVGLLAGLGVGVLGGWLFARVRPGALAEASGATP
jgi:rhomboid family protein